MTDIDDFLNSPHMPQDAGVFAPAFAEMLRRIPENWGRRISVRPGWYSIVTDLHKQLAFVVPDYEIHQIKEKFGTLRFYFVPNTDDARKSALAYALIEGAESLSAITCEECGEFGTIDWVRTGWLRTLCPKHAAERKAS